MQNLRRLGREGKDGLGVDRIGSNRSVSLLNTLGSLCVLVRVMCGCPLRLAIFTPWNRLGLLLSTVSQTVVDIPPLSQT